jgi:hypothetical protein
VILSAFLTFSGCQKLDIFNNADDEGPLIIIQGSRDIVIDENLYNSRSKDTFAIQDAFIENDSLIIRIEYGGGCGIVKYSGITNGSFMESYPVQLNVSLSFTDEDTCEALISKNISINLSNLADYYNDMYKTYHGTILIHLEGFADIINYSF